MAEVHQGINKRIYGRVQSDEEFTTRIKHIKKLQSEGYPVSWFRTNYNQIKVKRGGQWWLIDKLAEMESKYDWRD